MKKISKKIVNMQMRVFAVVLIFSFVSTQVLFVPTAYAATYTFTQSSWSGGESVTAATHSANQSEWNKYSEASSTMAIGATVALATSASTTVQTADTDFSAGTHSNTAVSGTGAGAGVALNTNTTYATWNPSDKTSAITLSGGNLIATKTTSSGWDGNLRATQGKSSGKWYWEIQPTTNGALLGIAKSTATLYNYLGSDASGYSWRLDSALKFNNGGSSSYGAAASANDVIGFALDMDGGTITIYKNNVSQGVMFSSLSGTFYPAASLWNSALTANFGASTLAYSPPSGYNAGFYSSAYLSSGMFTSSVIDTGAHTAFTTLAVSSTTPSNTSIGISVRAGNSATPDGTWTEWTATSTAGSMDISSLGTSQYVQYRAGLTTSDTSVTPTLSDVTFNYPAYPSSQSLISSAYDSGDAANAIGGLVWDEDASLPSGTSVTVSVRTASSQGGLTGTWTDFTNATSNCSKSSQTVTCTSSAIPAEMKNGSGDRWYQYKITLASTGANTPTVSRVRVTYVVNAAPDFQSAATASQTASATNAKVAISYTVRDTDATSGTVTQNLITPSFEYSTTSGTYWAAIPSGDLASGDTSNKTVGEVSYNTYSATWAATSTLPGIYNTTMKVRVTANDNEAANSTATSTSSAFTLDSLAPVVAAGNAVLDSSTGGTTAGNVILTATDDSQLQYRVCNDNTFPATDAQGNSCAWSALSGNLASTSVAWIPTGAPSAETVYLQVRDAYGNVTSRTLTAPATAGNFIFGDVSNPTAGSYGEYLSWTTVANATAYQLYYATTSSSASAPSASAYSLLATPATNSYTHSITNNLTAKYWYKVAAINSNGDVSDFAAAVGDVPDSYGTAAPDTTAPTVSAIATSTVLATSAVVTFTTSEIATSTVMYGTSQAACASYGSSQSTTAYATAQSVSLSGLTASTAYYFCVRAGDSSYNTSTATSTSDTGLALAFTTTSGPGISGVSAGSLTDTTATISWTTATTSDSFVYYSTSPSLTNLVTVGSTTAAVSHQVTLTGLTQGTAYYYYVKSTDGSGNVETNTNSPTGYYTISATRDTTAPVISNTSAVVKSETTAAIVWQTDENATSQVYYGTSSGTYSKLTSLNATKSIYHVMTLASTTLNAAGGASDVSLSNNLLAPNTTYYFVVVSSDTSGNTATSSELTFTTDNADVSAPTVQSIAVPAATLKSTTATVTFTTNEVATSSLQYRVNGGSSWTTVNSTAFDVSHSVALSGLLTNTTYNLQVKAGDAVGNASEYAAGPNFTTTGGPVISSVTSGSLSETSATISWNTSTSSDSYVYYSTSASLTNPSTAGNATMVSASTTPDTYQHVVTLSGLTLNTTYYYYVKSTDANADSTTYPTGSPYNSFRTTIDTTGPVITGISAPVKSATAAVITWTTDELSSSQVEYGTIASTTNNGVYGATTVANTTPTIFHIVTLSGDTSKTSGGTNALVKNTTYYYRVKSLDTSSNLTTSDENSFTTNEDGAIVNTTVVNIAEGGGGGATSSAAPAVVDRTAPAITNVNVVKVTPFGATVTFNTNEEAMGSVQYGETNDYGYNTGGMVWTGTHSINIKGLRMGTEYHIKVTVNDKAGNTSTSQDETFKTELLAENLGELKILDTTSPEEIQAKIEDLIESALPSINPPYINTPEVVDIGEDSATIVWSTNVKSFGSVAYSPDEGFSAGNYEAEISESDTTKKADHTVKIAGLKPNTKYHFAVKSYVFQQAPSKTDDLTFITKASKVQAQALSIKTDSFRVVWNTDEQTSSVVEYKVKGSASGDKKNDDTPTVSHDMLVENLLPGTTYTVKVYGYTKDGNFVEAKENLVVTTLRDTTPPAITSFRVDSALVPGRADRTQTIVSWKTDEPATSKVKYEEGSGSPDAPLSNTQEDTSTFVTNHAVILTTLKPGAIYRFQIGSADAAGNTSVLPVRTIITPRQTESVVDVIFKNFSDTFNFVNRGK